MQELGHDPQTVSLGRFMQQVQSIEAESLKIISRGARLKQPPRRSPPPASRTARAQAVICSRDSTEHGPAIITKGTSPPTRIGPISIKVSAARCALDARR